MHSPTIAVTGANGFVGGRVLRDLLAHGLPCAGLVRTGRALPPGQPRRELSEWSQASLEKGLDGIETVIHAASVVHRPGALATEHEAFNVGGTRSLLAAARSRGVRRVVFLSTIKVHGEEPVGRIDEETAVDRSSPYSSTKLDAERILLEASGSLSPAILVLRLCPVYGAGDKGNVRRMATAIARRRFAIPGDGSTRKSVVHVSTVAEAVRRAAQSDLTGVFVLADRVAPSIRELADTLAAALGRHSPPSVPIPLALAAAAGVQILSRLRGRPSGVSPELIYKSLRSTVCSPQRLEAALGMECRLDLREGVAEEIAWLRREKLL